MGQLPGNRVDALLQRGQPLRRSQIVHHRPSAGAAVAQGGDKRRAGQCPGSVCGWAGAMGKRACRLAYRLACKLTCKWAAQKATRGLLAQHGVTCLTLQGRVPSLSMGLWLRNVVDAVFFVCTALAVTGRAMLFTKLNEIATSPLSPLAIENLTK